MKIAIQARRIFAAAKSQSDRAVVNFIRELQSLDHSNQYHVYVAPGEDRCIEGSANFEIIEFSAPVYPLWEQYHLPRQVRRFEPDIMHCTSNAAPIFNIGATKLIITIEDVEFMAEQRTYKLSMAKEFERLYLKTIVPIAVQKCSTVITGSKFGSEQIQKQLDLCPSKIEVINGGIGKEFAPTQLSQEVRQKYALPKVYMLLSGGQDPEQNTATTMLSYEKYVALCRQNKSTSIPLVVIGLSRESLKSLTHMATWLEIKNQVTAISHVNQNDMAQLYSSATLFLHTPLWDNSEIEPLQAMACGTPIIAAGSNGSGEILGSAAMLSNPCDTVDVANKIMHLTTDQPLRNQLIDNGYNQIHKYRQQDTAQKIIEIYDRLNSWK